MNILFRTIKQLVPMKKNIQDSYVQLRGPELCIQDVVLTFKINFKHIQTKLLVVSATSMAFIQNFIRAFLLIKQCVYILKASNLIFSPEQIILGTFVIFLMGMVP
jgi:hypothetical protein